MARWLEGSIVVPCSSPNCPESEHVYERAYTFGPFAVFLAECGHWCIWCLHFGRGIRDEFLRADGAMLCAEALLDAGIDFTALPTTEEGMKELRDKTVMVTERHWTIAHVAPGIVAETRMAAEEPERDWKAAGKLN